MNLFLFLGVKIKIKTKSNDPVKIEIFINRIEPYGFSGLFQQPQPGVGPPPGFGPSPRFVNGKKF